MVIDIDIAETYKAKKYMDILNLYETESHIEFYGRKEATEKFCKLLYSAVKDEAEADKILKAAAKVTQYRANEGFLNGYLAAEKRQ